MVLSLTISEILPVSLEKRTFSYPLHSAPNLKMFPVHCIAQILYAESLDLPISHNTSVTDGRTDDNSAIDALYSMTVACQKVSEAESCNFCNR